MENASNILRIESLRIGFRAGRRKSALLPPLSASAGEGELVSVIGKNGIGKSTLLRTIAGIQKPLSGSILYNGMTLEQITRTELAGLNAYISTEVVKVNNMNVYDLVSLGRFPHTGWLGSITPTDHLLIMDAMEKTSVSDFSRRYIAELSDGERQKAMIARVLAQDTPVMLMDEPTAFLDIGSKFEILHLLYDLTRKEKKTIIFSTHDLDMALRHSDKIWLVLKEGLFEGAPEDLMLSGMFDHLFESAAVNFSPADGTWSVRGEAKGSVYVEGSGPHARWTEEALRRSGYKVSHESIFPQVVVSNQKWVYISQTTTLEFKSLYSLVSFLRSSSV